jgi:hypothetical protein
MNKFANSWNYCYNSHNSNTDFLAKGGCSDCCRYNYYLNNNRCGFLGISENEKILVNGTGYFKW